MSFEFLKKWIFNNELKQPIVASSTSDQLVGVIANYTSQEELIKVQEILVKQGTKKDKINFLLFTPQLDVINTMGKSYTIKDIKWAGYPQSPAIDEFIKSKYQKLYYLSSTYEPHQMFLLSKTQSVFKAGVHHKGIEQYLDFIVDAPYQNMQESLMLINKTLEKITVKTNKS